MSKLVIVESPAKAKTIKKYLGGDFEVVASMGHIRDLPKSKLGVDVENDFEPQYVNIKDKADLIKSLTKLADKSDQVFLATDPDREGEAISWHLAHILNLDLNEANRVTFNEITKSGIEAGMNNPRKVNMDLVNAQQARRILDRLVGYKLSPFLWKKVRKGLSAGRVQSIAVRLIVDREEEIRAFVSKEYWSISAELLAKSSKKAFEAKLHSVSGEKIELNNKEETDKILSEIENNDFTVAAIKKSIRRKSPAAPFITSTLQQEASRRLGFQSRRTMKAAQELYEGIEIESLGAVGLITYMRTDSLRISDEARDAAYDYIEKKYGDKYIPKKPNTYRSKRNTQDAHEAIRPTVIDLTPDEIKDSLSSDQYKLYKLIWERFMASQMSKALLNTVSVDINVGECGFKASGHSVKFDGFTVLYEEAKDDADEDNNILPELEEGQVLKVKSVNGNQHFTQPPARYSEATLIKALEENGIGRPSTYAPTITTIISRNYVEREAKRLMPTVLGEVTTQLMKEHFKQIVNIAFTAKLEDSLDTIGEGKTQWVDTLHSFYGDFDKTLTKAEEAMEGKRVKIPDEETDIECELCGKNMVIKLGRFGRFLACPGFPECKNTKKIVTEADGNCPLCGSKIHEKKSKKGRKFFGCGSYPDCNFMSWDAPIEEKCPECDSSLFKKGGKNSKIYCQKPDCGFEKAAD